MKRKWVWLNSKLVLTVSIASMFLMAQAGASSADWYTVPQDKLAYMHTTQGDVVIALNSDIAPKHAQHFIDEINKGVYNNTYFYRVIEGFVAQGGPAEDESAAAEEVTLKAEFLTTNPVADFVAVESKDAFAPVTGFINGFPAAADAKGEAHWLVHCPGMVAMARGLDKDSASNHFYAVLGQAPRHLDRNMSVFGRVVSGMSALQKLPRGKKAEGGVIAKPGEGSKIVTVTMGDKLPASQQRTFRMEKASSAAFQQKLADARALSNGFYHDRTYAPRVMDVCYYQPDIKEVNGDDN